jgi:Fe-S cluster biosynthesis and repair protein YggX
MPGRRDHVHHGRLYLGDQFAQAQHDPHLEEIVFHAEVSKEAWQGWLKHHTMLINGNRLNMADAGARKYLATQERHFFGEGADQAMGYVPPTA